jgi:hypothetical protein
MPRADPRLNVLVMSCSLPVGSPVAFLLHTKLDIPMILQVTTVLFLSVIFSLNSNDSAGFIILVIEDRRMCLA